MPKTAMNITLNMLQQ